MKKRAFETLHVFFSPIVARYNYARKVSRWRKMNAHNSTIISEWCPIDKVTVGKHTYGKINAHWYGQSDERIEIGNYCSIAGEVHFVMGGEHDYKRISTFPFSEKVFHDGIDGICKGPIIIEDDVWIGFGVIILSGVRIGKGSVIAAGSIVTKDVPPYSIWIGNSVKKKRFSDAIISELSKIDYSSLACDKYKLFIDTRITEENVGLVVEKLLN
ncbi:MAG: CatB-related O-acetyltransferase [Lachnospiraceae bacterium]|nr:CatB-related O-acetyltransferase [Lachnospiraceae bacterium]